ncbi:unnamed protein product [Schistosoma mattheei]|uniref:C2H2-type domain-containing protein n=1 Tax=Schistosoma mattheei TaxID=31246 RepID=A0A3P8ICJ4_9TREM|nr:unnamed protein product [Schistosoma mattheei]
MIVNRLAHTNLPQFILATHKGGHWSLVQLHYINHNINDNNNNNNSQTVPSNSTPSLDESHMANCLDSLNQLNDVDSDTKGNLTTHFNQIHNQNTSLPCPICEKYLSNRFNLDRHIRSVHSDYEMSSNSSLKVNSVPVSNTNEGAHLTNSMTVENPNEPPRGYYLYLSDSDCQQSINTNSPTSYINSSGNTQSVLQLISPTVDSKSVSLVADISLTPCGPSNPDAQLGVGGKLWKQNINIVQSPKSTISKSSHLC